MAVIVSFITPKAIGPDGTPVIGYSRIREDLALDGSTTGTLRSGEVFFVVNTESDTVAVAVGATPDADTTAGTATSGAGIPIPPNMTMAISAPSGAKLNAKALS